MYVEIKRVVRALLQATQSRRLDEDALSMETRHLEAPFLPHRPAYTAFLHHLFHAVTAIVK